MVNSLEEAYRITSAMTTKEDIKPNCLQRKAMFYIYDNVVLPMYDNDHKKVPCYMQPDYLWEWE